MLSTNSNRLRLFLFLIASLAFGASRLSGIGLHPINLINNAPQILPFSQNWNNTGLITTNNDWNAVPGIVGYRGDDLVTGMGIDPRTISADGAAAPVSVVAHQTNPDTFATGGVAEFEIANPTIALNGSGTADVPHIVIHLDTTGRSAIQFACLIRDLDASADDAVQQVDVQYRVGGTGNYTSVPNGYIADATTAGQATQATALNLTLPAAADNQALVEVRVLTTNAVGSDETLGIDDISVSGDGGPTAPVDAPVDFNGDGKTDFVVVRNTGGGVNGQLTWFWNLNGGTETFGSDWGLNEDVRLAEDFDGDGKDDITVWRGGPPESAFFYILQSQTGTVRIVRFGQQGDDPTVVGDYDGDGRADPAVYRNGGQSFWYYLGSANNPNNNITYVPWGAGGDVAAPGDYDGDGKHDFVIRRGNKGTAQGQFWMNLSGSGAAVRNFGLISDLIVPGDYDGDRKTDLAVVRNQGGALNWYYLPSSGGAYRQIVFGSAGDATVPGDYDGDGKTDTAVWRPAGGVFWIRSAAGGLITNFTLGAAGDYPAAFYNTH